MCRLLSKPSNVLVLDEPTNDLDMDTLELLEELLVDYDGTVLLVSHDRSFLNNVVTSTLVFEENGHIQEYVGGYEDWLRQRIVAEKKRNELPTKVAPVKKSEQTHQDKKALRSLEQKIEKLEAKQKELESTLMDESLYTPEKANQVTALQQKLADVQSQLKVLIAEWEQLM